MPKYNSIEQWANEHHMTLEMALDVGVSQNDYDEIIIPDSAWPVIKSHWERIEAKADKADKEWAEEMDKKWLERAEEKAKDDLWNEISDDRKELLINRARAEMTETAIYQADIAENFYNRR